MAQNSHQFSAFLSCFLIGSVLIILIRMGTSGTGGAMAAVLVAAAAIILLGWYYYRSRVKDLIRAGDELYYLGLLFTLVSLSYALVSLFILSPAAADLEQRTYDLIGSFGIALVSTIVGILARILLQGIEDKGREDEGREDENEKSSSGDDLLILRQNLREASDAFSHFTRMTQNQAEQTAIHSERLIKEFNERMNTNIGNNLEETAVSWRSTVREIGSQSQQVMDQITRFAQQTLERVENNLRVLTERVETTSQNIQTQLEVNVNAVMEMLEHMHSTNRSLNNLASNLETTEQNVGRLGNAATNAATRMNDSSTGIVNTYEAFKQDTQQLYGTIQHTEKEVQGSVSKMLELMNSINHSLITIASNLETTEQHVGRLGKTASNAVIELDEQTGQIINSYKAIRQGAQQQGELQDKISEIRGSIELLADHMSKLISSLEHHKTLPFRLWKN